MVFLTGAEFLKGESFVLSFGTLPDLTRARKVEKRTPQVEAARRIEVPSSTAKTAACRSSSVYLGIFLKNAESKHQKTVEIAAFANVEGRHQGISLGRVGVGQAG